MTIRKLVWLIAAVCNGIGPAAAELQCAPGNVVIAYPDQDPFFASEKKAWTAITSSRNLEGTEDSCSDIAIPGYESYPTKRCHYSEVDDGGKAFAPLSAQVILLDPSAQQLASWSVRACRDVGADDIQMPNCLAKLRPHIINANGAQFPVAGSVVESRCNSSRAYPNGCKGLADEDKARQPRNTWFRNGVSIDYLDSFDVHWDEKTYSAEIFEAVFDVNASDKFLNNTFISARIANAERQDWIDWRNHVGKPLMLPGITEVSVDDGGWQSISREVHKAACKSNTNELFNAVVYSHRHLWVQ
ncbi:hypothetical protein [Rhizobium leguminosarum]|uniref:hypothetical protein n=1 Tax=Rhizobium leguminosarum TaxID=384 RepID=UPI001F479D93|nr:hypothetical protein [Rhizobium leguminosarum]UIJ83149.1 hypothetical protein LZK78_32215 [Rhizobium leguminosarum]